ncbi:PAS domain-containing protein [Kovacikia minuta CCNUW1]|uniref:PAS domain-containing sensor histidine kinase n=1 Tax=Kovacikia minuta TaxID=2931930 RepID=UPI001CCAE3AB|nr:PAS domain-containing protein [Kovacikia minuta]UBF29238.1 PAS domain-containing protein [Kovacikia minuta CCNUW1]
MTEEEKIVSSDRSSSLSSSGTSGYFQDVIEQQAETSSRDRQRLIEQLVEMSPGLFYLYDAIEQRYVYINGRSLEFLGYTPETILAMGSDFLRHVMYPADLARMVAHYEHLNTLPEGSFAEIEYRMRHSNGKWRWFSSRDRIFCRTSIGQLHQVLGTAQEITDRKQVEEALETNLAQLEAVINSMTEGLVVCDSVGNILMFNPAALTMHGFGSIEEVRQPLHRFADLFELRELDGQLLEIGDWPLSRALAGETFTKRRIRLHRKDTDQHWVVQYSGTTVRNKADDVVLGILTITDITSQYEADQVLQASAERLSLALAVSRMGDWSWDIPTDRVTFSEQAAEIFAIPPGASMTWTEMHNLLDAEDRDRTQLAIERAIAEHSDYDIEYRVVHPNGILRWVVVKGRAHYDTNGKPLGMLGVVQDVTERQHAEAEREHLLKGERTARKAAEVASRVKDEFLAVLSHELRTPLNPILGWARLLRTHQFDKQMVDRALETIERNAKLQTELIEDLLDISRILQGNMVLDVGVVHLVSVIETALNTVRLAADAKGIDLSFEMADLPVNESLPGTEEVFATAQLPTHLPSPIAYQRFQVSGDAARLQQILWNLLSNAIKFTPTGGRVEVRLERVEEAEAGTEGLLSVPHSAAPHLNLKTQNFSPLPTPYAQIIVTDTGKGIRPEFLPYVFEYFRQEDSKTTRSFGGLGLGLAIVRHLTELHGGTVTVASQGENLGATFTVRLPLL